MLELSVQQRWPVGWAFDGRKNIYAPVMFLPQHETCYEVGFMPCLSRLGTSISLHRLIMAGGDCRHGES